MTKRQNDHLFLFDLTFLFAFSMNRIYAVFSHIQKTILISNEVSESLKISHAIKLMLTSER